MRLWVTEIDSPLGFQVRASATQMECQGSHAGEISAVFLLRLIICMHSANVPVPFVHIFQTISEVANWSPSQIVMNKKEKKKRFLIVDHFKFKTSFLKAHKLNGYDHVFDGSCYGNFVWWTFYFIFQIWTNCQELHFKLEDPPINLLAYTMAPTPLNHQFVSWWTCNWVHLTMICPIIVEKIR